MTRGELADELAELDVLTLRASLALAERSGDAGDYLEMADAVAATPADRALVAEHRAEYDLAIGDPRAAAARCVAALDHGPQTEGLWIKLLVALASLGEVAAIDAVLAGLGRLAGPAPARLVARLVAEPGLGEVRARRACRSLLERAAARPANTRPDEGD